MGEELRGMLKCIGVLIDEYGNSLGKLANASGNVTTMEKEKEFNGIGKINSISCDMDKDEVEDKFGWIEKECKEMIKTTKEVVDNIIQKDDFRDYLVVKNETSIGDRRMKCIKIDKYELSIQASKYHYCTPRKLLRNLHDYDSMEIAIFKEGAWLDLNEDEFFNEWKDREKFLELYDGEVGGYVPIQIIQSLFDYIKKYVKAKYRDTKITVRGYDNAVKIKEANEDNFLVNIESVSDNDIYEVDLMPR